MVGVDLLAPVDLPIRTETGSGAGDVTTALITPGRVRPKEPMGRNKAGSSAWRDPMTSVHPPAAGMATMGSVTKQANMRIPWRRSEYATALNPPTVV